MKRRQQMVGLAKPCRKRSIILHEIGHAIGMFHEQARPDRNSYIDILYDHILPPVRFNFQQIDPDQTTNYSIPYDYLSIMHYGETAFSYNRSAVTMRAKDPSFQKKMGKASRISFRDVMSVNAMYNCSGHCSFIPKCPFKEAFVGKDCRCWCPTEENDREPAKLCPDVPKVTPPRLVTTPPNSRGARPNQRQRDTNGVLLEIAFNPNGRRTSNRGASAVLTPVGRGHNFIRNPSNQGARMVPTSGNEGSQTLAATLSNLPESIRIGSLRGNGQRSTASRNRKTLSRNRSADRRPTFRRQSSTRSQRPSTATSATGDRLEQQLLNELNSLSEGNEGTTRPPSQPTPLLSGLVPSRSSSTDFNAMVSNVMGMLSGSRTGNSNRNTNGAVVSSQTPGGGVATAELKLLLQELNRLNSQNQMSPHIPIVSNVRHTHVRSRGRNADILSQRRAQNLLRELSDLMLSQSGRHQSLPLSREQISYLLQKVSSFNSPVTHVTHTHPVVIEPSAGHHHHHHHHQEHSHHHHREQTHHRREQRHHRREQIHHRNDVLSPIIENSHFHSNP
ncbi:lateral signaling target protein 2 homolog [Ylistrum balloti]|uniref:lateral signaling target protein 2 homolog n=1 Tax=Ylistrum balloti TaxID=509963 RepID=UPI0029059C41|nr:lateral signaling target protein 2 homolog [Ylistrum balloti]